MPVPSLVAQVPPGFDAWWARAAARNPEHRFPNAKEFASSLAAALGVAGDHGITREHAASGPYRDDGRSPSQALPNVPTPPQQQTAFLSTPHPAQPTSGQYPPGFAPASAGLESGLRERKPGRDGQSGDVLRRRAAGDAFEEIGEGGGRSQRRRRRSPRADRGWCRRRSRRSSGTATATPAPSASIAEAPPSASAPSASASAASAPSVATATSEPTAEPTPVPSTSTTTALAAPPTHKNGGRSPRSRPRRRTRNQPHPQQQPRAAASRRWGTIQNGEIDSNPLRPCRPRDCPVDAVRRGRRRAIDGAGSAAAKGSSPTRRS